MTGEEMHDKSLLDLLITGGMGALLAVLFQAARAARHHASDEWDWRRFVAGLASAAAVGALAAWGLEAFNVSRELSAVIIAMCGYTGGRLLDLVEAEVPETIQAAFDGLQKRLHEGKWKQDE